MKKIAEVILLILIVTILHCGNQENSEKPAETPSMGIHTAVALGNLDVVRQHIRAGTDLNEKDAYGSSPLIVATTFGKTNVAKALIENGADMTIGNNEGSTPLHISAFLCYPEIVEALLKAGADKHAKNNMGSTALDTVSGPFEDVKGIYDSIGKALGPLGLQLDYEGIKKMRPRIAEMLRDR